MNKQIVLFVVVLLFIQAVFALPAIRCGSQGVLEVSTSDIDEISILEESALEEDPCKDKYVCELSCNRIKSTNTCTKKQHFDLTNIINAATKPENFNELGVIGYSFKNKNEFPDLKLVPLIGFYNGKNHYYAIVPPSDATKKELKYFQGVKKNYFEENELGFLASPHVSAAVVSKYQAQFDLKPLYLNYHLGSVSCRIGRISKSEKASKIDFIFTKKSKLTALCNGKAVKVGKTYLLGYIATKATPHTIPVTKFSYKKDNLDDKFLASPFAVSKMEELKGFFADSYLRVCSIDRSQEVTNDAMDVLYRGFVADFYQVNEKDFKFKKKDVSTKNGNHLHSIQFLNWAYGLKKKSIEKTQGISDLGMFQKLYGYILGLRQFMALCDKHKYETSEISQKLEKYEGEEEFKKYSVIGTNKEFSQLATAPITPKFKKYFNETRKKFMDSITSHNRKKYCECSNFEKDTKFSSTTQGALFKKQLVDFCQDKCWDAKKKKKVADEKKRKEQQKFPFRR